MGITPACAGKTTAARRSALPRRDHPRMRGEDSQVPVGRGRGVGITPACAGKTQNRDIPPKDAPDHPRMRGEDSLPTMFRRRSTGSPPHARGRHEAWRATPEQARITPACAGKTHSRPRPSQRRPDHPRMRGEDFRLPSGADTWRGSPPHARGRRPSRECRGPRTGITPACAGKTSLSSPSLPF